MIRPGIPRLFHLLSRRRDLVDRSVEEEIQLHIALRAEQLEREGLPRDVARAEAARRFGPLAQARRNLERMAHRRERTMGFRETIDGLEQDFRYAARGLRRDPFFTLFAIATLALGIGANAAMYGIVDRLLLRGPDYVDDPRRVVRFVLTATRPNRRELRTSELGYVSYLSMRQATHLFDGVAAYTEDPYRLGRGQSARIVTAGYATADFFPLLGVRAARGRFFSPDEDRTSGAEKVVVLGDGLWRSQFGADPQVVGQTMQLANGPYTIIGVAPRGFTGVELSRVDLWMPMTLRSAPVTKNWTSSWNAQWLTVVGRLKSGASVEKAGEDATAAHRAAYDGTSKVIAGARFLVAPIGFTDQGRESTEVAVSRWLLGVTVVVLLIACTNVANLLLARAIRRRREIAVLLALGAARWRLARFFLIESLLVASGGGLAALAVATGVTSLVRMSLLSEIEWTSSPVSGRILLVTLAVTLFVGVVVGLAPAVHAARRSLIDALKAGAQSGGGRMRLGMWPTVLQATLTAALLVGAGLFMRSLQRARSLPLGFDADRVFVAEIGFASLGDNPDQINAARARRIQIYARALESVQRLPDVDRAALAVGSPFGNAFTPDLFVPGWDSLPKLGGGGPYISAVTSGRIFTAAEGAGTEPVAIVNATMAKTLWPGNEALEQCLHVGADSAPCARVVGIVEDAHRNQLRELPAMQYYIPFGQESGFGGTVLMVRPRGELAPVAPLIQKSVSSLDAMVEAVRVRPLQQSIDPLIRPWRLGATIFALGGGLALLVAALGLYSVMSYVVAQRTHEVGVRIALGAGAWQIVRLIVGQSVAMALAGIALGIGIALFAGRFMEGLLFNTSPRDPAVLTVTSLTLVAVAVLASMVPALRAKRVDPIRALKAE
jgi:predicted permease